MLKYHFQSTSWTEAKWGWKGDTTEPMLGERFYVALWHMLRCLCKYELHLLQVHMAGIFNSETQFVDSSTEDTSHDTLLDFLLHHYWSMIIRNISWYGNLIMICTISHLSLHLRSAFCSFPWTHWATIFPLLNSIPLFKSYYPITTPRRTSYTQIHLMDPSLLHTGEVFSLFLVYNISLFFK